MEFSNLKYPKQPRKSCYRRWGTWSRSQIRWVLLSDNFYFGCWYAFNSYFENIIWKNIILFSKRKMICFISSWCNSIIDSSWLRVTAMTATQNYQWKKGWDLIFRVYYKIINLSFYLNFFVFFSHQKLCMLIESSKHQGDLFFQILHPLQCLWNQLATKEKHFYF